MNIIKILRGTGIGAAALVAVTLLYAAVESPILEINTAAELDAVLSGNKLVVAEFYNPTCPVCKAFKDKHIFEDAAKALPHVKFIKISVVQGKGLHKEFNITSYPTFIYFRDKKKVLVYHMHNGKEEQSDRFEGYVDNGGFIHQVSDIFSRAELES
jgi:thioredoxin 1